MTMNNNNEQLSRMKSLMTYGMKTESKQSPYSAVEYQKVGADGKIYGIVREGTKYYIKTAPNKQNLCESDFGYIGGFRNRRDYEYNSYANAQKQFDLKMMSLKEACNKRDYSIDSWDLDKKEMVVVEASDKMKKEISRERQIMANAMLISEKKGAKACPNCGNSPCSCNIEDAQKDNIKSEKPETGDAKDAVEHEEPELPKEMKESKVNEADVLAWNRNQDYMDKSKGTEVGDGAPFDDAEARDIDDNKEVSKTGEMQNGVVEGASMHDADNQNTPKPGVGEVGDTAPFDGEKGKQIDEAEDLSLDDASDDEDEDVLGDEPFDGDEDMADDSAIDDEEVEGEPFDDELEDDSMEDGEEFKDDLESRVTAVEDLLRKIADKLGVEGSTPVDSEEYADDDDLFGDEEPADDEEEIDDCVDMNMPMGEGRQRNDDVYVYESKGYRDAIRKQVNEEGMKPFKDNGRVPQGNMNKLDDFGKHPAYQKKVMELPPKDMQEFPEYYDMNDDSVKNDSPYGEKIGNGAPFEIKPETIENAVAEAIKRILKKK